MADRKTQLGVGTYVKKVGERPDGSSIYQAGPRSKKYEENQIVPNDYAKSVRGAVVFRNKTQGLLTRLRQKDRSQMTDREKEILDGDYSEAQAAMSEFVQLEKDLKEAEKAGDTERINDIEQEINDKKAKLGS